MATRIDLAPKKKVPERWWEEPSPVPPELRLAPEQVGRKETKPTPDPEKTGGLTKTYTAAGEPEFRIGGQAVTEEEYKRALTAKRAAAERGFLGSHSEREMAELGLEPYAAQLAEQQRMAEAASRIGAQVSPTEAAAGVGVAGQPTPVDMKQLGLSVATDPSVIRSMGAGVGVGLMVKKGAAAGGIMGGPWGAVIGAVGGLAIGVLASVQNNIKSQKRDNLAAQRAVLTDGITNLNQLISLMNIDPVNAELYIEAMNQQLNNIEQAHSQLKIDTQSDLNLALSQDGTRELQRYENFYAMGGGFDVITAKAQVALASPDPETGMRGLLMSSDELEGGQE